MFVLNERLAADTVFIAKLKLCRVLLMRDSSFPWLILVPEREGVREVHELERDDRAALMDEINAASLALDGLFKPDKINIGALGNIVPQLHIHVIARRTTDRAWPGPVWGSGPSLPYKEDELNKTADRLKDAFERFRSN